MGARYLPWHILKACSAALSQQLALGILNREFESILSPAKLPQLSIRIGLHTGRVRSGNIGSERKMKFGCLGEPMKVASELEEICKRYGVGVVCSEDTFEQIPKEGLNGFKCRRLDRVKVEGGDELTWIYEVMGRALLPEEDAQEDPDAVTRKATIRTQASVQTEMSMVLRAVRRSTSSLAAPSAPFSRPFRPPALFGRRRDRTGSAPQMEVLGGCDFARRIADEDLPLDEDSATQ